jgi:hypothetical protein
MNEPVEPVALLVIQEFIIRHFFSGNCPCTEYSPELPSPSFLRWLKDGPRETQGRTPCDFLTAVGLVFQCRARRQTALAAP